MGNWWRMDDREAADVDMVDHGAGEVILNLFHGEIRACSRQSVILPQAGSSRRLEGAGTKAMASTISPANGILACPIDYQGLYHEGGME